MSIVFYPFAIQANLARRPNILTDRFLSPVRSTAVSIYFDPYHCIKVYLLMISIILCLFNNHL